MNFFKNAVSFSFKRHVSLLQREIRLQMVEKAKSGELKAVNGSAASQAAAAKRKRRWDQTADQTPGNATPKKVSSWDQADNAPEVSINHCRLKRNMILNTFLHCLVRSI